MTSPYSGLKPLEAYLKDIPIDLASSMDKLLSAFSPYEGRRKSLGKLIGGRLIIEDELCIGIETTEGTFKIRKWEDIEALLKKHLRILIVGERKNDLSTLIKHFPKECAYYASQGAEVEYNYPFHAASFVITNTLIQWKPCRCTSPDCPHKGLRSGWIEDIKDIYEVLVGNLKGTNPTPQMIQDIFRSIDEDFFQREGLSVRFFSRPGQVSGQLILTFHKGIIRPKKIPLEDYQLWNEAAYMAKAGASLGIGWLEEVTLTKDATHEDIISSHLAALASTPILTPEEVKLVKVEGFGKSEDCWWQRAIESVELFSYGIEIPNEGTVPPQHRILSKASSKFGVLPTYYPTQDIALRDRVLTLGKGNFKPIETIFCMQRVPGPIKTYKRLAIRLFGHTQEKSYFGKYIKYIGKVFRGKMDSYFLKSKPIRLLGETEMIKTMVGEDLCPKWRPKNSLPTEYDYNYEDFYEEGYTLPASSNLLVASSILSKEERNLRLQLQLRKRNGEILGSLKDSLSYRGPRTFTGRRGLGAFKTKTRPGQRLAQLNDFHNAFSGDGHSVDWLELLENTNGASDTLESPPVEFRLGLEVFSSGLISLSHKLLGTIAGEKAVCKLGSVKLLGPEVKVRDIFDKKGIRFRIARTEEEVQYKLGSLERSIDG